MSKASPMLGPVKFEMNVFLINPNGDTAEVGYTFGPGRLPDAEAIEAALREVYAIGAKQGYLPMSPSAFFNGVVVKEKFGRVGNFATPAEFEYEIQGHEMGELVDESVDAYDEEDI